MGSRIDSSSEFENLDRRIESAYNDACDAMDNYEFKWAYRLWWEATAERKELERKVKRREAERERKRVLRETNPEYNEQQRLRMRKFRAEHPLTQEQKDKKNARERERRNRDVEAARAKARENYRKRKAKDAERTESKS